MESRRSHCARGSRRRLWRKLQSNVGSAGRLSELGIRKDALHSEAANQTKRRYLDLRFNGHWDNTSVVA